MTMKSVAEMNEAEFRELVQLIVDSNQIVYGRLRTSTMITLKKYLDSGPVHIVQPFTQDQLRELKLSGLVALAYLRITGQL